MRFAPRRPSHATAVAYAALFVALGGTASATIIVSSNSQLGPGTVEGSVRAFDQVPQDVECFRSERQALVATP